MIIASLYRPPRGQVQNCKFVNTPYNTEIGLAEVTNVTRFQNSLICICHLFALYSIM